MKKGFDNDKYVKIQSKKIKERFKLFYKANYFCGKSVYRIRLGYSAGRKV